MVNEKSLWTNWKDEKIAKRELEEGRITYRTLADYVGDMVLCNNIMYRYGNGLEVINFDNLFDENGNEYDIFQYFIITDSGYEFLEEYAPEEIIFYDDELDLYVWGITHWGTGWDYVFTNIKVEK